MKAIIRLEVPEHQIGQEVSCCFKDTMSVKGICEKAEPSEWEHDHDVLKAYDNGFDDGLEKGISMTEPIIEIDGKRYKAEKPILKTIHKWGEVVIGGFREEDDRK